MTFYLTSGSGGSSSKPLTRKDKHIVVSEANFLPDVEISDKKTQVGTEDWVEGIKSNAVNILRSPSYAKTIINAQEAQEQYRQESQKLEKKYFENIAKDENESQENRMWAEANLNKNYKEGMKSFDSGNYREAASLLERAANDPSLNSYGKLQAIQKLTEIAQINNDEEAWKNWLDRMFKEMVNCPGFEDLKAIDEKSGNSLSNFSGSLSKAEEYIKMMKSNPQSHDELVKYFKGTGLSESEAQEKTNEILNFDGIKFPKN